MQRIWPFFIQYTAVTMAYNDDAVLARLSSLNESHDSIATAAQWIMFHRSVSTLARTDTFISLTISYRRHADRTVQLWLQRLKDSSSTKRLSLVYLGNGKVLLRWLAETAANLYRQRLRSSPEYATRKTSSSLFRPSLPKPPRSHTREHLRRSRASFAASLRSGKTAVSSRRLFNEQSRAGWTVRQDRICTVHFTNKVAELDKSRGAPKGAFGGAIFGGSSNVPSDFAPLVTAHQTVSKLSVSLNTTVSNANQEYEKQTDPAVEVPSAPVYAARLNGLLKTLATAENAVAARVKARETLVTGLEKLLEANRAELEKDQEAATKLSSRKTEIEEKKQQVEIAIMRALGPAEGNGSSTEAGSASPTQEPDRPEMEALTPPAMEALTPPAMEAFTPPPAVEEPLVLQEPTTDSNGQDSAHDLDTVVPPQSVPISTNGSNKRRRVDVGDFPDLGGDDGIDEDVAAMLKDGGSSYGGT